MLSRKTYDKPEDAYVSSPRANYSDVIRLQNKVELLEQQVSILQASFDTAVHVLGEVSQQYARALDLCRQQNASLAEVLAQRGITV